MPRQFQTVDITTFNKGFVSDASPLTFPENTAINIDNFTLAKDGSIKRRLGLRREDSLFQIDIGGADKAIQTLVWANPSGFVGKRFLVVQVGNKLNMYDLSSDNVIEGFLSTVYFDNLLSLRAGIAVVDNTLVVVNNTSNVYVIEYKGGVTFTKTKQTLLVRDVFGLDDDLQVGNEVAKRPTTLSDKHLYNLRNQTWGTPRRNANTESITDPVAAFLSASGKYPSNADTVNQALYSDPNDGDDRISQRFFPKDLVSNQIGTMYAPRGRFIIPVMDRDVGRVGALTELYANNPELSIAQPSIGIDNTTGGPTVVAAYSGRAFYAGFNGELRGGDSNSPRLSSYVLFSKLIDGVKDFPLCYQEQDPTHPDYSDVLDTDGGFIKIDGASNIVAMHNYGKSLIVLAETGVWEIKGGSDYGFTASNFLVTKLVDIGPVSSTSIIDTGNGLLFWSESDIHVVSTDQFGSLQVKSLSNQRIQRFYEDILTEDKKTCVGLFDSYEKTVRWVYGGNKELIYDVDLDAFYKNTFKTTTQTVIGIFEVPPYRTSSSTEPVTAGGEPVTVGGTQVEVTFDTTLDSFKEVKYLVTEPTSGTGSRGYFASLVDTGFKDFATTDAAAELITGFLSGGDFQRNKSVPFLTMHFNRTELFLDANDVMNTPSSCKVRAVWDWATSPLTGNWGREFEAYRLSRYASVAGNNLPYDNGLLTTTTKNRLRGFGKVLSLHMRTEPSKDCQLLGWSMVLGVNGNV